MKSFVSPLGPRIQWRLSIRPASAYDDVACPRCGAQVGEPCRTPAGREPYYSHAPRVAAYDEWERTT